MATETWGLLPKNQEDPEKIEEAIARMIKEHEEDEEAHLGPGQSLQSHKASEVIDHLVDSIVEDKIKNKEVTIPKIYEERFLIRPTFESLDGWETHKVGANSNYYARVGFLQLVSGSDSGDYARVWQNGDPYFVDKEDDPWFQSGIDISAAPNYKDAYVGVGCNRPWLGGKGFGFWWDASAEKFYAYYQNGGSPVTFEITGFDPDIPHEVRAEMTENGNSIKFYVDGEFKKEWTGIGLDPKSDVFIFFTVRNADGTTSADTYFFHAIYCQNI